MTGSLRFHPPCLATSTNAPPSGAQWLHQPKLDGYRLQAIKEARTVRLYTKGGQDWTERLAALAEAFKGLPARSAVLDGEIIMADAGGLPDFRLLHKTKGRRRGAELHMYAFDLLHLNGKDLRDLRLLERARRLAKLFERSTVPVLHLVPSFPDGAAPAALLRAIQHRQQARRPTLPLRALERLAPNARAGRPPIRSAGACFNQAFRPAKAERFWNSVTPLPQQWTCLRFVSLVHRVSACAVP